MAKNEALLRAITTLTPKDTNVLEGLLAIDPDKVSEFRKEVIKNSDFWLEKDASLSPETAPIWGGVNPESLGNVVVDPGEDYLSSADRGLRVLHQAVAEQRVTLGFIEEKDKEVLIKILNLNPNECRAYLAERVPEIKKAHGWKPSVQASNTPDSNDSHDVLTDDAIKRIKEHAAKLLLEQLIKQADEKKLSALNVLISADDLHSIQNAAVVLGFSETQKHSLSEQFKAQATQRAVELTLEGLTRLVNEIEYNELVQLKPVLNAGDLQDFERELFRTFPHIGQKYQEQMRRFSDDKMNMIRKEIQGILCAKYLQDNLVKDHKGLVKQVLQAENEGVLKDQLQPLIPGDQTLIENAGIKNQDLFKIALVKNLIGTLKADDLKALEKADDLKKFKEVFTEKAGEYPLDFIKEAHLGDLQQEVCTQRFKLLIESASRLGTGAHSELIKVFRQLDPKKQKELLGNPDNLPLILNAKDPQLLTYYFGEKVSLKNLLVENRRITPFKAIHNFEVAKILANFKPSIELNDERVKAINEALKAHSLNPSARYLVLINAIYNAQGPLAGDKNLFNNAFGLKLNPPAGWQEDEGISKPVKAQLTFNYKLFRAPNPVNPGLVNVLLSIPKTAIIPISEDMEFFFDQGENAQQCIQAYVKTLAIDGVSKKKLAEELRKELTPTLFNELRDQQRKQILQANAPESQKSQTKIKNIIKKVNEELKEIQSSRDKFAVHTGEMSAIANLQKGHVFNPAFQEKARVHTREMQKTYEQLSADCYIRISELNRSKEKIKASIDNVRLYAHSLQTISERFQKIGINNLEKELIREQQEIDRQLKVYEQAKEKIDGVILPRIVASEMWVYHSEKFKSALLDRSEIKSKKPEGADPDATARTEASVGNSETLNIVLEEKPKTNQVRCFDVVYSEKQQSTKKDIPGRFIYDAAPKEGLPVIVNAKGDLTQPKPGKMEIVTFPKTQIQESKIDFAMTAAIQLLATLDVPPSKENPIRLRGGDEDNEEEIVKYLWTALVMLGEKDPNMKFAPEVIEVKRSAFKPETQMGRFWGFTENALYHQFQNSPSAKDKTKHLVDHKAKLSIDKSVSQEMVQHAKQATQKCKKELDEARENIKKSGPAVAPNTPPKPSGP